MRHVDQRAGVFRVRMVIPPEARHAFPDLPKSGDIAISLSTRDPAEAFRKAPPIIADLKARIAEASQPALPIPVSPPQAPAAQTFRPADIEAAFERWRMARIDASEAEHFCGMAPVIAPLSDEAVAISERRYRLSDPSRWFEIIDFDETMRAALASQGIHVPFGHPVLKQAVARGWFADAWSAVERHEERFRQGDFTRTDDPVEAPPVATTAVASGPALSVMLERFIEAKQPKSVDDLRYHFRRLIEAIGDVDVTAVQPSDLEAFLIKLRRFPKTRVPAIADLPFNEILEKHADCGPALSPATVWKHFVSYGQVFAYAAMMVEGMGKNPILPVMPTKPKPTKKVRAYTPAEISALFGKPLFTGCDRTHNAKGELWGYRDAPGSIVLRDGRYWMPLLNLFHGNRMEEWGGAKVADIKVEDGIDFLDLRHRDVKNDTSKRQVPIHPTIIELGFLTYVKERAAAGDEYLFPEFPHDVSESDDPEASTRQFTKWWGYWSDANGFDDPTINFHSFRHTFIRACRNVIPEEIRDLITGHVGAGGAGRGYGQGTELQVLHEAIQKVRFPSFSLK